LVEREMLDREKRAAERRIRDAKFPVIINPAIKNNVYAA